MNVAFLDEKELCQMKVNGSPKTESCDWLGKYHSILRNLVYFFKTEQISFLIFRVESGRGLGSVARRGQSLLVHKKKLTISLFKLNKLSKFKHVHLACTSFCR